MRRSPHGQHSSGWRESERTVQDNSLAKALAMVAQLGFVVACPMLLFIGGGAWLDARLHTVPWLLLLGVLLGMLSAGGALYQVTKLQSGKSSSGEPKAPYKVEGRTGDVGTPRANKRKLNGR